MKRYKVIKVFRKSARKKVLETNLTEAEAQRVVQRYPDSQKYMAYYLSY